MLLVDPMLATGSSLVLAYKALCEKGGTPKYTHVAAVIASEQGIDYVQKNMPRKTTTIWAAAVDEELTSRCYIVRVSAMPVTWPTARRSEPGTLRGSTRRRCLSATFPVLSAGAAGISSEAGI